MARPQPRRQSTLEQDRSRETRRRLLDAGRRLVWARGFEQTSVQDVADAAGVSKATFYFYFPTKEALLVELAVASSDTALAATGDVEHPPDDAPTVELLHRLVSNMAATTSRSPKQVVERTIVELFHAMGDAPDPAATSERQELLYALGTIILRGQHRGEVRADVMPVEVAVSMELTILGAMVQWAKLDDDTSLDDMLWRNVEVIFRGISTEPDLFA